MAELARLDPFGLIFGGDFFDETDAVFAVHTNEGRYSAVQAVKVDETTIHLRYRTWEKRTETLQITGDFHCEGIAGVKPARITGRRGTSLTLRVPDGRVSARRRPVEV